MSFLDAPIGCAYTRTVLFVDPPTRVTVNVTRWPKVTVFEDAEMEIDESDRCAFGRKPNRGWFVLSTFVKSPPITSPPDEVIASDQTPRQPCRHPMFALGAHGWTAPVAALNAPSRSRG